MNNFRDNVLLAAAALVLSAAWVLAWIAGLGFNTGSSLVRGGLVIGWVAIVWTAVAIVLRRATRDLREARTALECLAQQAPPPDAAAAVTVDLSDHNPWADVVAQMRQTLSELRRRAEDAEQQRSALEIRNRRQALQGQRINGVLQGLVEPVLVVDDYDELVLSNASAQRLLGFNAQGAEKQALSSLVQCEKLVGLLAETRRRKSPVTRTDELELVDPSGQPRSYSVTASNILAEAEPGSHAPAGSQGVVAVLRDISGHKAIQRRNAEFVSAVSHEMKTPLAGIKAYVEMLVDGDAEDDATREEFLSVINSQADRLRRLIDNLLNLSRIESGVVQVQKRNHSLNEVLEEALHVLRPAAEEKRIELVADLSPMHLGVLIDRDQMLQAAINLLSNAVKYTHPDGKVTLKSRLVGQHVEFEVEDSGVGISPEDQPRVFEKFYRVQKDKQMASGTGLGLPLAKSIVEEVHGGRMTLTSQPGVGSTFSVTLPCTARLSAAAATVA